MGTIPGVNLLPATGEFTYDTIAHQGQRATENKLSGINTYAGQASYRTDMELAIDHLIAQHPECTTVALVVAWFFNSTAANSCNIYPSTTYIGGTFQAWNGGAWVTDHWRCSGLTEASSGLIPISMSGSTFDYGGTPSDPSVVRCIEYLKSRGLRVVFYPFLLGDIPGSFPWRGRISFSPDVSSAATAAVNGLLGSASPSQFTRDTTSLTVGYSGSLTDWTYRRMILHYANLCVIAGGVDLFLVGSELRGLETIRGPGWTHAGTTDGSGNAVWDYPFVAGLIQLANDVRGIFDGGGLSKDLTGLHNLISYSADWSDWMGYQHPGENGQWPHLDQLYVSANIDLVCFDNYLPLSDWTEGNGGLDVQNWSLPVPSSWPPPNPMAVGLGLPGTPSIYRKDYLKANIEGGEKFHWCYNDSVNAGAGVYPDGSGHVVSLPQGDRLTQTRQPYYPGQQILANKQLRWWWNNQHHAIYDAGDGNGWIQHGPQTQWAPQSKSITFAEYGFATIDRSTNQPNVFYDAKSSESDTAFWSRWISFDGDGSDTTSLVPLADPCIRAIALQAIYEYWLVDGHNATSGSGVMMIEPAFMSVWNWDARPFPTFSAISAIWGDAANWPAGFWLEGKLTTGIPMLYPLTWPVDSRGQPIRPTQILLNVNMSSRSGGQSLAGNEQIVVSPAARWEGSMTFPAMDRETLLSWRGFVAAMNGRYGTALVPAFERSRQNQTGVTAAAASMNATALTLTLGGGDPIIAGNRFSIANRLYEVQQSVPQGGGVYAVNILPWLRGAIAAGTPCEFLNPVSTMRFASDTEGKLDLASNITAHPQINLIEAF
jgi:hypothetical protein